MRLAPGLESLATISVSWFVLSIPLQQKPRTFVLLRVPDPVLDRSETEHPRQEWLPSVRAWKGIRRAPVVVLLLVVATMFGADVRAGRELAISEATEPAVATNSTNKPAEFESLFNPAEFPKGWVHFSAEKGSTLGTTWKVEPAAGDKEAVLVCLGRPFGYIRTERSYRDCELSFEWKYPSDPNANSGVLVFTNGADKIWPQGVQVQLHRPNAGSILPDGGVKTEKVDNTELSELSLNEWHKCQVTCRSGRVVVSVDGRKVSEATGCDPRQGSIAIQSEGSEIHFRRILLRVLK